jgi:hypothetical protein
MQDNKKSKWTLKIDWLNIVEQLGLDTIHQIPEYKKGKAISKLEKEFGSDSLADMEPNLLESLLHDELRKLMQKELQEIKKSKRELRKKGNIIPLKHGGIIKIDTADFKNMKDAEEGIQDMLKGLFDKYFQAEDDDDDEDEDSTGYYI